MVLQYYVVETATGKQIEIDIESATNEDLTSTKEKWQSDWTSEFIRDPKLEKYAAKTDAGEIVALGAYREDDHGISVFIANIEAHPESNPTISTVRKYAGIGRMMIAYGIQLSIDSGHGGIVTFEAKTDELYDHYIKCIIIAFISLRKATHTAELSKLIKLVLTPRKYLMGIRLVSYIPYKLILWKIKYNMQSHCQFDNAKIRSKMSACYAYLLDKELPYLSRKLIIFYWRKFLNIIGLINLL